MSADGWASASRRTTAGEPGTAAKRWSRGHESEDGEAIQELQKENSRLKKLVADQALDMLILEEAARPYASVP
jgi:hypothetical protein